MTNIPEELKYTSDHEWVRIDGKRAEVGITEHAQKELGDIVFLELPSLDDEIEAGDEFGTIESVKAVSPLYMPVTGKIVEINSELKDHPELVNDDCYDEGWIIRFEIINTDEQDNLLDADAYKSSI